MPDVKYSTYLAQQAADWTSTIAKECAFYHPDASFGLKSGQNLFVSWSGSSGTFATAEKTVKNWADGEFPYYSLATWTCQAGQSCGHFTQVMWVGPRGVMRAKSDLQRSPPFAGGETPNTVGIMRGSSDSVLILIH